MTMPAEENVGVVVSTSVLKGYANMHVPDLSEEALGRVLEIRPAVASCLQHVPEVHPKDTVAK